MLILSVFNICILIVFLYLARIRAKYFLHMCQLSGYDNEEYKKWLKENTDKRRKLINSATEQKSPLVWTDRAKRLFSKLNLLNSVFALILFFIGLLAIYYDYRSFLVLGIIMIIYILLFFMQDKMMILANKLATPREIKINKSFYDMAQKKVLDLKKDGLRVVGITGSFGKTSVKFILNTILCEHFNTLNTPSSFNTPMGLSKIINNELNEDHEIFIAELGAKKKNEIDEVARLVSPDIGIITAIGMTHMHLFKSIENIISTKYELIENLKEDSVAIFNMDNSHVLGMSERTNLKKLNYSIEKATDIYASDISVDEFGSKFTINYGEKKAEARTCLLGKHNISNILAAVCAAISLGMELDEIAGRISHIKPVEHRLQLIDTNPNMIVIDDAFNSNPVGFRAALDVLGSFKDRRKIIVTPGMIELGDLEEEENKKIGMEMAGVVDIAILVGKKRTEPIKMGLLENGFSSENLIVLNSLTEASNVLAQLGRKGDVVLFENDLPDSYSEE